ncbi:MAG: 4Fe-4S dicluster domain-containing protein [Chloroflexi bacterium]|nr:4Fe-4S dicluster domain-containing protein [Chloroflexota bacterium]MBI3040834.1 4Fe-4S dicluster domain-containing protein [Chloroflexota bacterium]
MARLGMVIDLSRCMGCRACVEACKVENNTPKAHFWMHVFRFEEGEYPNVKTAFLPRPCMHCDHAPCVKVCPVEARFKREEDGIVLTDFNRCIGCRYCVVACPYGVNSFNWKKPNEAQYYLYGKGEGDDVYGRGEVSDYTAGAIPPYLNPDHKKLYGKEKRLVSGSGPYVGVTEKCTFCVHRVAKGLLPACVANCPVEVFHFGDLDDPESEVSKLLGKNRSFRLLQELGTQPKVFYIGAAPPSEEAHMLNTVSHKEELGKVR